MDVLLKDWVAWEERYADEWNANVVARIEEGTALADEKRARLRANFEAGFHRLKSIEATNERFFNLFRERLPEPWRSEFTTLVNSARFPDVYRKCPVEIAIGLFREVPDLPPEQLNAVETIWSEYEIQRDALRQRIVTAHERWETAEWNQYVRDLYINRLIDPYGDHPLVEDAGHPAAPLFEQAIALARSSTERLRALYSDDEFAALPLSIRLALEWWRE